MELLESRIVSNDVKRASLDMRRAVERMVWHVANVDVQAHQSIKESEYASAFQRFIEGTYTVFADLNPYEPETKETQQLRRTATRIASTRTWEEDATPKEEQSV